jgi:putative heme-binding domain-containing protein
MRAQTRALELGLSKSTDYLVQSIAEPATFLVPGFQNGMPEVFKAPIALTPSEIKAVILYLQSLGGTVKADEIQLPPELLSVYRKPETSTEFKAKGDVEAGRILFFDAQGPAACAGCHIGINAKGRPEGSSTGPDLTAIASIRTPQFILREILHPDSLIVRGYETTLIKTVDGRLITGIVQEEDEEKLVVIQTNRHLLTIGKNYIKNRSIQNISMMPNNYQELLKQKQLDDLMAYLLTLAGD